MKLSTRVLNLSESKTCQVAQQAAAFVHNDKEKIDLSIGQTDYPTPKLISDEAKKALDQGRTFYTNAAGVVELREAYCNRVLKDYNLEYDANQIVVTNGAKQALFSTLLAIINPDDEVIVFAPYWNTFLEQISFIGGKPVIVKTQIQNDYQIDKPMLKTALSKKTRAIIINSPCNPTGAILNQESLTAIANFAIAHDLWIISDETYDKLIFDNHAFISIASISEEIKNRTIVINSTSKTYAMTGWRIGFAATNHALAEQLTKINSQTITHPSTFSQYAAVRALENTEEILNEFLLDLSQKRTLFYDQLTQIEGLKLKKPQGTFFLFPDISNFIKPGETDLTFCTALLDQEAIAVTPGSIFGAEDHIRISYALSYDKIHGFIERFKRFLSR